MWMLALVRDLDFRKVLRIPQVPEFPQPALRAVVAQLFQVMVVAVVPAPALEPVSLHFHQP